MRAFLCPHAMKTLFCVTLITVMLSPDANALFGHVTAEKERRIETEQQLSQEQQRNGLLIHSNEHLHVVISVLSAGAVVMLITGAAIGSKGRNDATAQK